MCFAADLHIHSKYSRATSRESDLEHLAFWARRKGIAVLGTGDFTHPAWFRDIEEKLVPAEPGLYRLRPDLEREVASWPGAGASPPVRFALQVEVSTIYKRGDRTRKVHHLVYAAEREEAARVTRALARIGNVASDGRPILGLDSRHLLEITLEGGPGCYLVPAHIWTPWFSALGLKSGFDAIEECYGDLAPHIFAVETGLSSDPPMNRLLSGLDRFRLVSNSDAHSPAKIAREACVFDTDLDYFAMRRALQTGDGYNGTLEFFAEEGKYHLDGHRKCGVSFSPAQSRAAGGVCPQCGKPLTRGTMSRVADLADREAPLMARTPYRSIIPLAELVAELEGVGAQSKAVGRQYEALLSRVGPEVFILLDAPLEDVKREGSSLLAEAISRMREGRVLCQAGFDGQFGVIRVFADGEVERLRHGGLLFDIPGDGRAAPPEGDPPAADSLGAAAPAASPRGVPAVAAAEAPATRGEPADASPVSADGTFLAGLDPDQRTAAGRTRGPLVILAGPGTGKTRTLTHRIAHLVLEKSVPAAECLAVTFTRRAAREMVERLDALLGQAAREVSVHTFHSLGFAILREHPEDAGLQTSPSIATAADGTRLLAEALSISRRDAQRLARRISRHRREGNASCEDPTDVETASAAAVYEKALRAADLVDFDDLILLAVRLLEADTGLRSAYRSRYRWVSVDEGQDMDRTQYRLLQLLVPPDGNLCVIGDPDQSIYGFRGADVRCFQKLRDDFPGARIVPLTRNYRSTPAIVEASMGVVAPQSLAPGRRLEAAPGQSAGPERIEIHRCATDRAEAEFVVHTIERMIGGSTFFSVDSGRVHSHEDGGLSFGDFAVLYRTHQEAGALVEAFRRSGMPFQERSHGPLARVPAVAALLGRMRKAPVGNRPVVRIFEQEAAAVRDDDPELDAYLEPLRTLALRAGEDLPGFLSEVALGIDADLWDERAEAVSLLTLHAAKGLEFAVVFIIGCEDGLLPLHTAFATTPGAAVDVRRPEWAEERRLFFVGMTRARTRLILSYARRRLWRGRIETREPSPFLDDIARRLREDRADSQGGAARKTEPSPCRQLTLFEDA